ncbi:FAD-binding oxidoreductase [Paenibacillus sp. y28]|uniref:FAD-binding oxidoreductase n=1 Tax=Paenibacillus sp. y28 TaxID=3129110 RepID=UPI003015ECD1
MAIAWEKEMADLLGADRVVSDEATVEKLSKDYYWYSPVLDSKLKGKVADGVVVVKSEQDVEAVLAYAYRNSIPVTVRGAGTGNYGQAVPLEGGILLDLSKLDSILEIGDGYTRVQCGVKMGVMEKKARETGQELRIFPSTFMVATIGGFVSGGSGGLGSITWGNLWDGNVLEAVIYTMEERPRRLVIKGEDLFDYIHSYGTTGIMTELTIPLAPRHEWLQTVFHFDSYEAAARFSEAVALDESIRKRLVSSMEWPIPEYFTPLSKHLEREAAAVLLETEDGTLEALEAYAGQFGGRRGHTVPAEKYKKTVSLSDFTWNHTTLWALKTDPTITYLQASFKLHSYLEQFHLLKETFGDEVLIHNEWMRAGGRLIPVMIPLVRYTTQARLYDIIDFFEANDMRVSNPHTWVVNEARFGEFDRMERTKLINDPRRLLNPGKINL